MALMDPDYNDKVSFLAEWYDIEVSYLKKFLLNFFPSDNSIELYDRDLNRIFLKRTRVDGLCLKDMFVGNTIRVHCRQIKITEYADCRTRKIIGRTKEHTFAIIKPRVLPRLGEIISEIENNGFQICNLKMCNLTRKEVLELYEPYKSESFLPFILEHLSSGTVVAAELVGENAIERWLKVLGPNDPIEAKKVAPNTLRAKYGRSEVINGFHGSTDEANTIRETAFFFSKDPTKKVPKTSVLLTNTTCCVIKPHAVQEGKLGPIISAINESQFYVNALQMFYLSNANADEFLEVYKGITNDFNALLVSFIDGPCVVLEIAGKDKGMNVHEEFRMFCGPPDSDIARQIRPLTLRARFGCDKYKNAVHCTDLPEDIVTELEYFFKILSN